MGQVNGSGQGYFYVVGRASLLADERLEHIVSLVEDRGFISVKELSGLHDVSEVTIRRDLQRLYEEKRVQRTHGGAASLRLPAPTDPESAPYPLNLSTEGLFTDRVDVLVTTSCDPHADRLLLDRAEKRNVQVIAESIGMERVKTLVAVDNFQAGLALGRWAGHYARQHFEGRAYVLDLTYHLDNTQTRSQGFVAGLTEILPTAQIVLSINAQSARQTAYQLTSDALHVYPHLNIIFAINDATAWGAIQACRDNEIDPNAVLVIPFGLEGDTLKNALITGEYCKVGLAMFPEIVGPVCAEAAINACNNIPMDNHLVTPYAVLTPENLPQFYERRPEGWQIRWDTVNQNLTIPLDINRGKTRPQTLPRRIGLVVPYVEHEWYKNLCACLKLHIQEMGIEFEVINAAENLKDEVSLRKWRIAQMAAELVQPGEVILIGDGQISIFLAEQLSTKENITVITNSVPVFEILRNNPHLTLILTGGLMPPTAIPSLAPPPRWPCGNCGPINCF
jgi:ABC-type sugar transport system substrate-binding protein